MKVTSLILAGGKYRRLGRNKALEIINGKSIIERIIGRLESLSSRILIVTSPENTEFPFKNKAEVIVDLMPGMGPMGGIYTGLAASNSSHVIAVACDMPFLNTELLRYMVEVSEGYDAIIPRLDDGKVESLHAVYSKSCLDIMKKQIEINQLKIYVLLKTMNVRYIEPDESRKLDPQSLSYFNINRQSDLDRAIEIAKNEK
jgi:molybdopterin-guanine dinucleotide biosynthesis protein A